MSVFPSKKQQERRTEPMNRRVQIAVLAGLLAVLPVVAYKELGSPAAKAVSIAISEDTALFHVENPELRLDLLEDLKKFKYDAAHRNIFSSSALLPARPGAALQPPVVAKPAPPAPPPGPPALVVPAHFFGYVTDAQTGVRRAFFKQDEDGYVLGVGELLAGRFRLVQIADSTAELEETATGRRTTLPMEDEPAQPDQNQVAQVPTGGGSGPPGFLPAPLGQRPVGFAQMPIGGGPSPLDPQLVPVPAAMNRLR
jgi:hypothetical protein